jgi:hypothetical protein
VAQSESSNLGAGSEPSSTENCGTVAEAARADVDRHLFTLLGDLSDAISVLTVVHRSLTAQEIASVGDEEVALRHALSLLRAAYTALDMASLSGRKAFGPERQPALAGTLGPPEGLL